VKALITGIGGFAAGHLAEHLLAQGDEVWGTSRQIEGDPPQPPRRLSPLRVLGWNLAQLPADNEALRAKLSAWQPDCIYHLAGVSVPDQCGTHAPTPYAWAVNVEGTARVLALAASLPRPPRVLVISSSHVYAPVEADHTLVNERSPLAPQRAYGITKRAAEDEARRAHTAGLDVVVARPFQHTGPRQFPPLMLPQWIAQLLQPGSAALEVYTRDAWIDLTDVRDVVRAYRLLAVSGQSGETYNIGSGVPRRSGDLLAQLLHIAAPERPVVELRPGVKFDPIADLAHLRSAIDWQPEIPIAQTIADAWHAARRSQPGT
jgi:GDP-4-dehydro-6-deoxy-D-mannose reductase